MFGENAVSDAFAGAPCAVYVENEINGERMFRQKPTLGVLSIVSADDLAFFKATHTEFSQVLAQLAFLTPFTD